MAWSLCESGINCMMPPACLGTRSTVLFYRWFRVAMSLWGPFVSMSRQTQTFMQRARESPGGQSANTCVFFKSRFWPHSLSVFRASTANGVSVSLTRLLCAFGMASLAARRRASRTSICRSAVASSAPLLCVVIVDLCAWLPCDVAWLPHTEFVGWSISGLSSAGALFVLLRRKSTGRQTGLGGRRHIIMQPGGGRGR